MALTLTWPLLEVAPPIELVRFRKVDFFPGFPNLSSMRTICVGTKSRNLGDALALSSLPAKLKRKYPHLRVTTYPRGFNPIVFRHNPSIDGVSYLPEALYGDDANFGEGQLIQLKERFFGVGVSDDPAPEIHLSDRERAWARTFTARHALPGNESKPICVLHAWGSTRAQVAPVGIWDEIVRRWSHAYRFWQVGILGDSCIQGCEYYALQPRRRSSARRLFALMGEAQAFVGVDSGPMHAARAFGLPSLVLMSHGHPARIFENRARAPYFLHGNWKFAPLYERNRHLAMHLLRPEKALSEADAFFAALPPPAERTPR